MLTARNVILMWIAILVISVAWACYGMLQPPDSGGHGEDTYGTRWAGHRAIFEVLRELNIPVRRQLSPPTPEMLANCTLVLWQPDHHLAVTEAAWLQGVKEWVESGGRVVLASTSSRISSQSCGAMCQRKPSSKKSGLNESLTDALGLKGVSIGEDEQSDDEADGAKFKTRDVTLDDVREAFRPQAFAKQMEIKFAKHSVRAAGTLAQNAVGGQETTTREITLQEGTVPEIAGGGDRRTGAQYLQEGDVERCVAAAFRTGAGEVVVISMPDLIANGCLGTADNAPLAVQLLAAGGREVVFDEFYHGLTIRGNPMWLLAQRTFGSVTLLLLVLVGGVAWRYGTLLGLPLESRPRERRSLGEYIGAMSRLLNRGRGSRAFVAKQVRDGVLWSLRKEYNLPPEGSDVEELLAAVHRRQPQRVATIRDALAAVDALLAAPAGVSEASWNKVLQRVAHCL